MTRCGVTSHPKEWKWSSYSQHTKEKGFIQIDFHDIYLMLGSTTKERQDKYVSMMEEKMAQKGLLSKQPQVTYGLVYGSESFVKEILSKYTSHKYYQKRKCHSVDVDTHCLRKFKGET